MEFTPDVQAKKHDLPDDSITHYSNHHESKTDPGIKNFDG